MELVQGEGGYYEGDTQFFKALIDVARENNIAVIADEVQSFCRTTQPFAFQHFGLDEFVDIVTIGKISQVCATLFTDDYKPQPGLISQTFTGSTWAIVAARAIIQGLIDNGNFGSDGKNSSCISTLPAGSNQSQKDCPVPFPVRTGLAAWLRSRPLMARRKRPNSWLTDCTMPDSCHSWPAVTPVAFDF